MASGTAVNPPDYYDKPTTEELSGDEAPKSCDNCKHDLVAGLGWGAGCDGCENLEHWEAKE